MSYGGITADILFHEPKLFEKYMEDTLNDLKTPLIERLQLCQENMSEMAFEILNTKEAQVKVLSDYLYLIIEKTQEKIFEQSDKIETFEHDFSELKMENQRMSEELEVLRDCFNDTKVKKSLLEEYLQEIEQKYEESQKMLSNAQYELNMSKESEHKFVELSAEQEVNKNALKALKEEKQKAEDLILTLKEENSKFKEEAELKNCMESKMNQLNSDYEELKVMYVKQTKSYDMDKQNFESERRALKEELDFLSFRSIEVELELEKTKAFLAKATEIQTDSTEDSKKNLNFKFSSVTSIMIDQESNRISSEGQESTANSLENFVPDNYDAMRGSIINNENYDPNLGEKSEPQSSSESLDEKKNVSNQVYRNHMARLESKRRDIFEEFFLLTTQSVLLNSPYFNALAGIDNSSWFAEASSQGIPYYKWYKWIETKFEDIHKTSVKATMIAKPPEVKAPAAKKSKKGWFKKW